MPDTQAREVPSQDRGNRNQIFQSHCDRFPNTNNILSRNFGEVLNNSFESVELRIGGNVAQFSSPVILSRREASSAESQSDQ